MYDRARSLRGPIRLHFSPRAWGQRHSACWTLAIHGFDAAAHFGAPQWIAIIYIGIVGSAVAFILWVFALSRTSPTKTAVTMTVNPVFASAVGAIAIGEGIGLNLIVGLAAVAAGIWLAAR
jgi:drug/metabolite transporter (DMT)-like permease